MISPDHCGSPIGGAHILWVNSRESPPHGAPTPSRLKGKSVPRGYWGPTVGVKLNCHRHWIRERNRKSIIAILSSDLSNTIQHRLYRSPRVFRPPHEPTSCSSSQSAQSAVGIFCQRSAQIRLVCSSRSASVSMKSRRWQMSAVVAATSSNGSQQSAPSRRSLALSSASNLHRVPMLYQAF
jgi:hypothetical protein